MLDWDCIDWHDAAPTEPGWYATRYRYRHHWPYSITPLTPGHLAATGQQRVWMESYQWGPCVAPIGMPKKES